MIRLKRSYLGVFALAVTALVFSSCGSKDELESYVDPYRRHQPGRADVSAEKNFAKLMNQYPRGKVTPTPWAGYWWPYTTNGIADGKYGGSLSPAGKYDAARGGRTQAQAWEVKNHGAGVRGVEGWWGHCNGWSVAAALIPEPKEPIQYGDITFTVADLKALVTEAAMEANIDFYGERVEAYHYGEEFEKKYEDVVPSQVFLLLTHYIGKRHYPLLIDRYTGSQVWNQPLTGYEIVYPKPEDVLPPIEGSSVHRINLTLRIWWSDDGVDPGIVTPEFNFEEIHPFSSRELTMELWLDGPVVFEGDRIVSSGDVVIAREGEYLVGGKWTHGLGTNGHPDFIWVPHSIPEPDPSNPEPYANPFLSMDWIKKYIMTGTVDPTTDPVNPTAAPSPRPSASPGPSTSPGPRPSPEPTLPPLPTRSPFPTLPPWPDEPISPSPIPDPTRRPTPVVPVPDPVPDPGSVGV